MDIKTIERNILDGHELTEFEYESLMHEISTLCKTDYELYLIYRMLVVRRENEQT